jgi:hypothetical protein
MIEAPYRESRKRVESQSKKIIELLRNEKNGITNTELQKISLRYGAIIGEMQRKGYDIIVENIGGGLCKYYLLNEPEKYEYKYVGSAKELLFNEISNKFSDLISSEELVRMLNDLDLTLMKKPRKNK